MYLPSPSRQRTQPGKRLNPSLYHPLAGWPCFLPRSEARLTLLQWNTNVYINMSNVSVYLSRELKEDGHVLIIDHLARIFNT